MYNMMLTPNRRRVKQKNNDTEMKMLAEPDAVAENTLPGV